MKYLFRDYDEAEEYGRRVLTEIISKRALLQGIETPQIEITAKKKSATAIGMGIFLETLLSAKAKELK